MKIISTIFRSFSQPQLTLTSQAVGGRKEQQDAVAVFWGGGARTMLAVLADGAGGHRGGAEASRCVVAVARKLWEKGGRKFANPVDEFHNLCREAHAAINHLGESPKNAPRSTIVAIYIEGRAAWWANIGDSRLYRVLGGSVVERSKDHTMAQILCDQGEIKDEDISCHPDRVQLLKALGGDEMCKPSLGKAPVSEGDGFLLCSDGFWESTTREQIGSFFKRGASQASLDALVGNAVAANGAKSDNVSVCAVVCKGTGGA